MGSHPYLYFTPYQKDIQAALNALREREFQAGRYDPAMQMASPPAYMFQLHFPLDDSVRGPGAQHASIDEAMDEAEESGTGSILDLARITSEPDFCAACPLDADDLVDLFGTSEPSRATVEGVLVNLEKKFDGDPAELFWEQIERGQGRYIVVYEASKPTEIFFAGYSFD